MVTKQPDIKDDQRFSVTQACQVLQISRATLHRASQLGSRCGGIDYKISRRNGKKYYLGKELIRYWKS